MRKRILHSSLMISLMIGACDCGDGRQLTARNGEGKVDPTSIDFGEVIVGREAVRPLTLENIGDYTLVVKNVRLSQPEAFTIAQRLPDEVEPGDKADAALVFSPPSEGAWEGVLTIETDDSAGTHEVQLRGTGIPAPATCQIQVAPASVQYPSVQIGGSAEQSVTLDNVSTAECMISRLEVTGDGAPDFSVLTPNPGSLAPGAQATIDIRFSRTSANERTATFEVESTDAMTPVHRIPLLTGGSRPALCVMPAEIHFGVTSGSATRDITVTACGDHDVSITALDFTTSNAEIGLSSAPGLPMPITVGASRMITVRYTPADQTADLAVLTIRSDDPLTPSVEVEITGSPDIVPEDVGRFLYFWQIDAANQSNIVRIPLQGGGAGLNYWGQTAGQTTGCPGCHQVSRDGRYVAVVEFDFFQSLYVVDTMTNARIDLPLQFLLGTSFSWRPDVGGNPAYQFVVGVNGDLRLGSINGGFMGDLAGASDPNAFEAMPAWGPDGEIVFVRGQGDAGTPGFGFVGPTDLVLVPETGGTATPVPGASGTSYGYSYPAYSPNGRWISYSETRAGASTYAAPDSQVRMVAADRSGTVLPLAMINGNNGATGFPTWSRDGSYISISSNRSGGVGDWDIYIAPIDQMTGMELGAPTNLNNANTPGFEHAAQWSP
jgi:hypothetical protein